MKYALVIENKKGEKETRVVDSPVINLPPVGKLRPIGAGRTTRSVGGKRKRYRFRSYYTR